MTLEVVFDSPNLNISAEPNDITVQTGSQIAKGEPGPPGQDATAFVVNYTITGQNTATCDKTYAEILAAAQGGQPISITAVGGGLTAQTSNIFSTGTFLYSILRYEMDSGSFIIIRHSSANAIVVSYHPDLEVDTQLDGTSGNPIANAAVVAALNNLPAVPTKTSDLTNDSGFITGGEIPPIPSASDSDPLMDGTADPGSSDDYSRADHVHPSDTSKLDVDGVARSTSGILTGHVDSTSTSTAFTATIPGIADLHKGVSVWLTNGVVTSASGFTLNVNNLGAKPVYSSLAAASRSTTIFNVAYTLLFVYNEDRVSGGCWDIVYGVDSNTNTIGYQLRTNSTRLPMAAVVYRYRLLFTSADGAQFVPANTSSSTDATAARTVCPLKIDPHGGICYYSSTASVAAGSMPAAAYLWTQYVVTLGYSFNRIGGELALTAYHPVYVKCAPQSDGSAIIDPDTPYVQALPSTADGKIYIFLGVANTTTTVELVPEHPVYWFRDGAIGIWHGPAESIDISSKLDKDQGSANAGQFMVVGSDGVVVPSTAYLWTGGSY